MRREIYCKAHRAMKVSVQLGGSDKMCGNIRGYGFGTANIITVGEQNVRTLGNTVCSAGLRYYNPVQDGVCESIVSRTRMRLEWGEDNAKVLRFCDWFLNRSPYSICISTRKPETMIKEGIIIDTNFPANLVVGATIAQRVLWEYTKVVKDWFKFVESGMNESAAFVMAHCYSVRGDGAIQESVRGGHCAIGGAYVTEEYLKNFVKGSMVGKTENYNKIHYYDKIHVLWGGADIDENARLYFYQDAVQNVNGELIENQIPNPFYRTLHLRKEKVLEPEVAMKAFAAHVNKLVGGK